MVLRLGMFLTVVLVCFGFKALADKLQKNKPFPWFALISEPLSLDPHHSVDGSSRAVIHSLQEGLLKFDTMTGKVLPALAREWTLSPCRKIYTFTLRKNLKWSDGTPITTEDFIYSFRKLIDPRQQSPHAYKAFSILNARDLFEGEMNDLSLLGVSSNLKQNQLVIKLVSPNPDFIFLLTHFPFFPVPRLRKTPFRVFLSSGPYLLERWHKKSKKLFLKKNPHYWNDDRVSLSRFGFRVYKNFKEEEKDFVDRKLLSTSSLSKKRFSYWEKKFPQHLSQHDVWSVFFLSVNTKIPPFDNKDFRALLSLSINREKLSQTYLPIKKKPAYFFVPPGMIKGASSFFISIFWTDKVAYFSQLKEKVFSLFPNLSHQTFTFLTTQKKEEKEGLELITREWRKKLGLNFQIKAYPWKEYIKQLRVSNYHLARLKWVGDYPSPLTFLSLLKSDHPMNFSRWKNADYDHHYQELDQCFENVGCRRKKFDQMEKMLSVHFPVIPLLFDSRTYLRDNRIQSWQQNIYDLQDYSRLSVPHLTDS